MKLSALAAAAALALTAGSAWAGVTFISYGVALPPGESLVTDFNSPLAAGYTMNGTASLLTGTSGNGAAPAYSATTSDPGQYLSVLGGKFETFTTPLVHDVSVYIGSLDNYNTITFTGPGGSTTYTGADLAAFSGADNGNQTAANTNGRFVFSFAQAIDQITFSSSSNSFEIADLAAAVPEPASWALMLIGFGALGAGVRSRRRAVATA